MDPAVLDILADDGSRRDDHPVADVYSLEDDRAAPEETIRARARSAVQNGSGRYMTEIPDARIVFADAPGVHNAEVSDLRTRVDDREMHDNAAFPDIRVRRHDRGGADDCRKHRTVCTKLFDDPPTYYRTLDLSDRDQHVPGFVLQKFGDILVGTEDRNPEYRAALLQIVIDDTGDFEPTTALDNIDAAATVPAAPDEKELWFHNNGPLGMFTTRSSSQREFSSPSC